MSKYTTWFNSQTFLQTLVTTPTPLSMPVSTDTSPTGIPGLSARAEQIETQVTVPGALLNKLKSVQLLHRVPFQYLVPSPDLLPPESMRLFFLDPNWVEHVVDGMLAAASLGRADDDTNLDYFLGAVHRRLDEQSPVTRRWTTGTDQHPVTGLLLRSIVVKHYPDLEISGFRNGQEIGIIRQDKLSDGVLLILFDDLPERIEIEEPKSALRYGFARTDADSRYADFVLLKHVPEDDGSIQTVEVPLPSGAASTPRNDVLRPSGRALGVVDIKALASTLSAPDSSTLALHLQRTASRVVLDRTTPPSVIEPVIGDWFPPIIRTQP